MASIGATLGPMIQNATHGYMKEVLEYGGPLGQPDPSYFIEFCNAIANGISQGSAAINFATIDKGVMGTPPIPGVGLGIGIQVDRKWFHKNLYIRLRQDILDRFKQTIHEPWYPESGWPENGCPKAGDPKGFLSALCKGIAYSVADHFPTAYTLNSAHPQIYMGKGDIIEGAFFGLSDSNIKGLIVSNAPRMKGSFFPPMVGIIAQTYVEAIHKHSTAFVTITGICVPGPSQVCGVISAGAGTGVAV